MLAGGVAPTDYESISTVTVGSGGTSSVSFTSIPSTYSHLQIRAIGRSTSATFTNQYMVIQFNSDTTSANYAWHGLSGDGSSPSTFAASSSGGVCAPTFTAGGSGTNMFGAFVLDILDYSNTNKYKTARSLGGHDQNGVGIVRFSSGVWMNTNSVSSIQITPAAAGLAQYSSFALYGIKS